MIEYNSVLDTDNGTPQWFLDFYLDIINDLDKPRLKETHLAFVDEPYDSHKVKAAIIYYPESNEILIISKGIFEEENEIETYIFKTNLDG